MKKISNLRAANRLEKIGKFSAAISSLEEFISVNPTYDKNEQLKEKIKKLTKKLTTEDDSKYEITFKPLLEIPKNILKGIFSFILETLFGWLIFL